MGGWNVEVVALCAVLSVLHHVSEGGTPKVSWKECNVDVSDRQNCGHRRMKEEKCYQRGCCWSDQKTPGQPMCYYSKLTTGPRCNGPLANRTECGFSGIRKDQCLSLDCCWQPKDERDVPWCYNKFDFQVQGTCGVPGIPPRIGSSRVVGGVEAIPHSWPWQASLQFYGSHFCGASIINEYWLVSAGHCEMQPTTVVLGMHSQTGDSQESIEVESLFVHDNYGNGNISRMDSDIMLIKLQSPITFTDMVSPVCLPDQDEELNVGTRCYITGWGTTELFGEGADKLQQAVLPVLSQETCQEWYSKPKNWYYETNETLAITDTMLCAGYEEGGRSGCHGDSGGPYVCLVHDVWKLFGAVSWGGKCGYEEIASVFARVSYFRDWIDQTIEENY